MSFLVRCHRGLGVAQRGVSEHGLSNEDGAWGESEIGFQGRRWVCCGWDMEDVGAAGAHVSWGRLSPEGEGGSRMALGREASVGESV